MALPSVSVAKIIMLCWCLENEPDYEMLGKFQEYQEKAEAYHLYHSVQRYTVGPVQPSSMGGVLQVLRTDCTQ